MLYFLPINFADVYNQLGQFGYLSFSPSYIEKNQSTGQDFYCKFLSDTFVNSLLPFKLKFYGV